MLRGLRAMQYVCPTQFAREMDVMRKWPRAAGLSNVRNDRSVLVPTDNGDLIVNNATNDVFVNACPHRKSKLLQRPQRQQAILCPYHHWAFDGSGRCRKTPRVTKCVNSPHLHKLASFTAGNVIMAGGTSVPFPSFTKTVQDNDVHAQRVVRSTSWRVEANYKCIMENFLEYLHLPAVHPELNKASPLDDHRTSDSDYASGHIAFRTEPARFDDSPMADLVASPQGDPLQYHFHAIFPNFFTFMHPSHAFSVFLTPVAPGRTVETAYLSVWGEQDNETVERVWEFYRTVNVEDIVAVERVQQGLASMCRNGRGDETMRLLPYWDQHVGKYVELVQQRVGD